MVDVLPIRKSIIQRSRFNVKLWIYSPLCAFTRSVFNKSGLRVDIRSWQFDNTDDNVNDDHFPLPYKNKVEDLRYLPEKTPIDDVSIAVVAPKTKSSINSVGTAVVATKAKSSISSGKAAAAVSSADRSGSVDVGEQWRFKRLCQTAKWQMTNQWQFKVTQPRANLSGPLLMYRSSTRIRSKWPINVTFSMVTHTNATVLMANQSHTSKFQWPLVVKCRYQWWITLPMANCTKATLPMAYQS